MKHVLAEPQHRIRTERRTTYFIFAFKTILKKSLEYETDRYPKNHGNLRQTHTRKFMRILDRQRYIGQLDLEKAFDCVPKENTPECLK